MAETGDFVVKTNAATAGENHHALKGIWDSPSTKTDSTSAPAAALKLESSDSPVMDKFASSDKLLNFNPDKSIEVAEALRFTPRQASAVDLQRLAHSSVGRTDLGKRSPANAETFPNYKVPPNVKCAATSSEWLVKLGVISNRDYKIRVNDITDVLSQKGFSRSNLSGNLDVSKFPDGPIGFIVGKGQKGDASSHIGYVEKMNGKINIIHNRVGKVVKQDISEKFYNKDGTPAYRELDLYRFPGAKHKA